MADLEKVRATLDVATTENVTSERSTGSKVFLAMLGGVAVLYAIVVAYHVSNPQTAASSENPDFLERCRQYCLEYGLVATGDVRVDAEAYLEAVNSRKLSDSLQELLSVDGFERAVSEDHPLLGTAAPDFVLLDAQDQPQTLADFNRQGPVILVFYYGYSCSHCVAQLIALQKDLEHFRELHAEVVAVSADLPASTREKYAEYGKFRFPVLSDPEYAVSEAWGVYLPPTDNQREDLLHGTFVIDRAGRVVFANRGYEPFVDNRSLLQWLNESG